MTRHLLFTACDIGTANFLLPVLKQLFVPYTIFAQGKAASLFREKDISFTLTPPCNWSNLKDIGEELLNSGVFTHIIAGTSWGATVDKAVTQAARNRKIPTVAIVEHWNLYRERFSRLVDGNIIEADLFLPDCIWVNDNYAKEDAISTGLPKECLLKVGQPFLESQHNNLISKNISSSDNNANNHIVFVSERIKEDFVEGSSVGKKYDEFTVLKLILDVVDFSKNKLVIKLHPQEEDNKYDDFLKDRGLDIEVVKKCDIAEMILRSHKIIGMGSMLLLEAALVRDDVISILPNTDPEEFIGNKIGATLSASTASELKKYLGLPPAPIGTSPFGERFTGSTKNLLKIIENFQ